ncbi:hypothetical protein PoB_006488500 [Plakobranchus ocellatus]|uniref:Uncharacterized protein n=1 Tax=Plakobranchus ocellatus TaxID=259542 RepID=A0AAV4D2N0_9GAST|nr:hypothetical protein PoB_006488500 [Plakobranchus ocellatus]
MTPEYVLMLDDQSKDGPDCKQVLSVNHMDAQRANRSESEGGVSTERGCSTAKINYVPVDVLQDLLKFLGGQKRGLLVEKGYNQRIGLPSPLPGSLASSVPQSNLQQMKECDYLQPSPDPESSMSSNTDTSDNPVCGNDTYVSPSSNKLNHHFVGQNRRNSQTEAKKQRMALKSNKGRKRLLPKVELNVFDTFEFAEESDVEPYMSWNQMMKMRIIPTPNRFENVGFVQLKFLSPNLSAHPISNSRSNLDLDLD